MQTVRDHDERKIAEIAVFLHLGQVRVQFCVLVDHGLQVLGLDEQLCPGRYVCSGQGLRLEVTDHIGRQRALFGHVQ
ncbi:MAG: hypothetical protein U0452_01710 [Anaerolineae bacterium]